MDREEIRLRLAQDKLKEDIDTKEFAAIVRPILLSAIYRSTKSFAKHATITDNSLSKAEIKSQSTAAKAFAENAKLGFALLEKLDTLKPAEKAEIINLIPKISSEK